VAVQLDLFSGSGEFLLANIWFPFCCVGGFQWCVCYDVRKLNLREGSRDWNRKFLCYFLRCEETDPGAGGGGGIGIGNFCVVLLQCEEIDSGGIGIGNFCAVLL
jgi:hypothetical protein